MTLTLKDVSRLKCLLLKANDIPLLEKILEIEDYMSFHGCDELEIDVDWRRDREEERQ